MFEDHISSGIGHSDDAEMVMYILVNGFTKDESQIKIDFSVECEGKEDCRFMLQSVSLIYTYITTNLCIRHVLSRYFRYLQVFRKMLIRRVDIAYHYFRRVVIFVFVHGY